MSLRRMIAIALLRIIATVLVVVPAAMCMTGPATCSLIAMFPAIWFLYFVFPLGVLLHWLIAKSTKTYTNGAYWVIFMTSVFMLLGIPLGTIMGGVTIWVLRTSSTFQRMRNGGRQ